VVVGEPRRRPLETDKHVYAQAFGIYGLAAHARAAGDSESLEAAQRLFALVEDRARDRRTGSYGEAFDAEWRPLENRRLAAGGLVGARTGNTHLHLIEAYTGLLEARPDRAARAALRALLELFLARFIAPGANHTHALLDATLRPLPGPISYGHDIEASWLLVTAARAVGDDELAVRNRHGRHQPREVGRRRRAGSRWRLDYRTPRRWHGRCLPGLVGAGRGSGRAG